MSNDDNTIKPTADISIWFTKLPANVQTQLRANPNAALNAETIKAITRVGGIGPTTAHFVDTAPNEHRWNLNHQQRAWLAQLPKPEADSTKTR